MWLNIFKIIIILSVTATAVDETIFTGILNVLKERKAANSTGDVDLYLFTLLFTGVIDTYFNNTVLTARIPHKSISIDYDGALRDKIVKFLIEYPKTETDASFDERLLQQIYNILIEHSKRTTDPFIKLLNKSYYLSDKEVTWYDANKSCVDMDASLISQEENDERKLLFRLVKMNFYRSWWVSIDPEHLPQDRTCPFLFDIEIIDSFLNGTINCTIWNHFICEK